MATIIYPDGTTEERAPAHGRSTFTLAELQEIVGGYIELVPGGARLMFVNEDGLRLGPAHNPLASYGAGMSIVGTAILCTPIEAGAGPDEDSEAAS